MKLPKKYKHFRDPEHPFVFGGVLFIGTWISMMISTVNGAGTPIMVMQTQSPANSMLITKLSGPAFKT